MWSIEKNISKSGGSTLPPHPKFKGGGAATHTSPTLTPWTTSMLYGDNEQCNVNVGETVVVISTRTVLCYHHYVNALHEITASLVCSM